jgi:uncharacterized protein YabE (DUF348 family)
VLRGARGCPTAYVTRVVLLARLPLAVSFPLPSGRSWALLRARTVLSVKVWSHVHGRRVRRRRRVERARLAAQAAVLAFVIAGTTAFATLHKTVTLDVDGELRTVDAFGRTVGDVLATQGIEVGERDLVVPALDAGAASGAEIVVRHARQVTVMVDGAEQTVWTTALTVEELVAEMGMRGQVRASASRGSDLGRDGLMLSTTKTVYVTVDGETETVVTTASTVREALRELGVVLGEHDRVSVPLDAAAVDGLAVLVTRVTGVTRTETVPEPYATVRQDDPMLAAGREVVGRAGQPGTKAVTVLVYEADGVELGRLVLAESVIVPPVDEVIRVGTFTPPPVAAVEPGTARAIGLELTLARGWDETQFACLDALWSAESGWRVDASNGSSGAYGIPQALPGSKMASVGADWQSNPSTQITWGLGYIAGRYGTPCDAWAFFQARHWY